MRRAEPAWIAPVDFPTHISAMRAATRGLKVPLISVRTMLDGLRQFIADVVSPNAHGDRKFDDTGYRLAATALLVHVISLDGQPSAVEKRKLHSLLESHFGLDPGTADQLIASATLVEGEAVDLYHFTSVIMRSVDDQGRLRIVEMMWELVYADGEVSEFEDNVVWRAADLLAVSSRDRIELKHRVAARQPTPVKDSSDTAGAAT
jgi:uncharacterized tellurite resistance protein B-like protein